MPATPTGMCEERTVFTAQPVEPADLPPPLVGTLTLMSQEVAVITDSAASLPPALAQKWGLDVVPLQVIVDDEPFAEGEQIGPAAVLDALVSGSAVTTSQPSVAAFEDAYARAAAAGATHVVAVLISSKLSGTVNCARLAAENAQIPVTVVDTQTLAMAAGFAAVAAIALARDGGEPHEVAAEAKRVAESSHTIFTVDTLEYLRRGGRMPAATAAVGRMLSVRPVFEIVDGEVAVVHKVRTTNRARQAVLTRAEEAMAAMERPAAAVMILGDVDQGDKAAADFETKHQELAMVVSTPVSAVLAVHTGPGTLAVVVVDLPSRVR